MDSLKVFVLLTILVVTGCTSVGNVEKLANGSFSIDAKTASIIANKGSTAHAIAAAYNGASEFCAQTIPAGKAQIISAFEDPTGGTKGGRATLQFRCTR